ncbi:MAG TPA: MdtA/MuxA family multidrug efflux RND transporter periplasmic adaptor subunit [Burkholderiales bacterium]|nr:MdtA/MuxA family multidrug efflux RND transporter periplasmic adaptor subunit [Burkholderiales bacterium]
MTTPDETRTEQQQPLGTEFSATPRERHRRWWLVAIVIVVAAVVGGYYFWPKAEPQSTAQQRRGKGGPNAGRPMPVVAAAAKTADVDVYLSGLGTVTPLATVTVKSRVDGQLVRVLFREGQMVKAGELLAEVDPRPFQVQLTQAEGQMARDQAQLHNAQIDLERYRTLFAQDSIAKQQLDTQGALVRQFEGAVKADQGQVDNARLQLTYSRVTAPVSGRVGLRQVDPGNIVHASDQNGIVIITQLQPITVVFTIPEDNVHLVMGRVRGAEKLRVDAFDRAEKVQLASGMLLTVDNQIDPATGTVKLKAQFANENYALFPNQFVNARMLVDVKKDATVIPSAAVQRGTPGTFVYVVKSDNTVTVRPVKLGPVQGENIAVEAGLKPGELVVTDGADKLREDAKIELPGADASSDKGGPPGKGKGEGRRRGEGKGKPPAPR